jgi:scyllo-inositol 2-dehydrogenase (NADP+)
MNILIYGFGRMGLTHFSILKGLNPELKFSIIEPNKILRLILKKNIDANFYSDDSNLKVAFDITLITTPPSIHLELFNKSIKRGDKKIFIEKPFGGHSNIDFDNTFNFKQLYIGYVLRFNPCIQWVKSNISAENIHSIHGQYLSNTIESKPKGWRNGRFSGVLNEMGSHVIDLLQYIIGTNEMDVQTSKKESIISDVDDIVEATLKTKNNLEVSIYLNWVKKEIRKPVFGIDIKLKDGSKYFIDQQQIKKYSASGEYLSKLTITDLAQTVPFYLRGVDFTNQMKSLLGDGMEMAKLDDALGVNIIMNKILKHENNTRR